MNTLQHYRARPHWSYSSLNQILHICSLQWFFEKIAKVPRSFRSPGLAFGSTFHRVMEWIAYGRMEGRIPDAKDAADLFHELWERETAEDEAIRFGEKTDAERCAEQGRGLCQLFVERLDPEEQIVRVSEAFAVPVGDSEKPLVGELDCVVSDGNQETIVDWKTSARRWPKDQAGRSLQATAYLYADRQLHPERDAGFRFDVLVKNKTPVMEQHNTHREPDAFQRLEKLVALADRIVKHELYYPADTSFYCAECPFAVSCAQWHQATESVAA